VTVNLPNPNNSLRSRIARRIAGSDWPQTPEPRESTTVGGLTEEALNNLENAFFHQSTKRQDVYEDVIKMDDTIDEVAVALDMMADNAISPDGGSTEPFTISYMKKVDSETEAIIQGVIARTNWQEKAYEIARGCLLMGDEFRQFVIDDQGQIVRLMYMPPESMIRNEDDIGLLMDGKTEGEWAYEQRVPRDDKFIAGFAPWQMLHLRWNKSGRSAYGRSLIFTARTAWRKLQAMEEALVINWITRAFARLLFTLDVTNKPEQEAKQAIDNFKRSLQSRQIAKDVVGMDQLSVVKDIFIGQSYHDIGGRAEKSLTDAKVLDTSSTGYAQIKPIEYYRSKILMALRTPPPYLGIEEFINAKATLTQEDRRYQRFLRRIQNVLTQGIKQTVNLQLALNAIDPRKVPYVVTWWTPSWSDVAEDAQAMSNYAQADAAFRTMGVVDRKWIATRHLRMSDTEWNQMDARVEEDDKYPAVPVVQAPGNQGDTDKTKETE